MTAEEYIKSELLGYTLISEPYLFRFDLQQLIRVIKYFTEIKCKEQRELCADNLKDEHFEFVDKYKEVGLQARYLALNSPEPKF